LRAELERKLREKISINLAKVQNLRKVLGRIELGCINLAEDYWKTSFNCICQWKKLEKVNMLLE